MGIFIRSLKTALISGVMVAVVASGANAATHYIAKIGHLESAQQTRNVFLEKVAKLVNERTGGEVEFKLYPEGQLGTQQEMTQGVQLGTLEATVAPAAFLGGFNPAISILDIPYLLPDDNTAADKIMAGPFGKTLCDTFSAHGVKCIGFWPNGKKDFTSNKPIATPADFAGQKFRVMDSKILIEQFKGLGASAVALPFGELYTSLQTGVVDGEENPLDTIKNMKYYEVQKYLVLSNHGAMEDVILFNPTFWNSLPEKDQKIITDTFNEVIPALQAHKAKAIEAALTEVKAHGMKVRTVSDAEKAELRDLMYPKARDAYLQRAGEQGKSLIGVYETAYKAATGK